MIIFWCWLLSTTFSSGSPSKKYFTPALSSLSPLTLSFYGLLLSLLPSFADNFLSQRSSPSSLPVSRFPFLLYSTWLSHGLFACHWQPASSLLCTLTALAFGPFPLLALSFSPCLWTLTWSLFFPFHFCLWFSRRLSHRDRWMGRFPNLCSWG